MTLAEFLATMLGLGFTPAEATALAEGGWPDLQALRARRTPRPAVDHSAPVGDSTDFPITH